MTGESKMLQSSSKGAGKKIQRTASKVRGGNQDRRSGVLALQGQAAGLGLVQSGEGTASEAPSSSPGTKGRQLRRCSPAVF